MIALEPEAAAKYCRFLPAEKTEHEDSFCKFKTGSKVLSIDAEGGTVYISVQEVAENGSMKNIYKASGGDWGEAKVDEAYVKFLENMLVEDCSLISVVSIKADKLKVNASVVTNFFKAQVEAIVDQVSNIIEYSRIGDIAAVVLVGGFSNCHLLMHAMKTKFDDHKIIVPNEPDLIVLKGAVIFGHKPELISQRVNKYTFYGVEIYEEFIEQIHKSSYKVIDEEGDSMCKNVFDKHITAGQCLIYGDAQGEEVYHPTRASQCVISFPVYFTLDPVPMYVTDEGCHIAGVLRVPLEGSGTDRS
ncbi:heat shock 70 kDa protein 12A-like [Mya arenaria]|uniref:heat shock 70 kDa protein 12A-like n=1 Tax=Mya arenaria TaxID=6604 RepID=UPI0022E458D9|nr:heat shock 70 kDa protein 12A-like [Mya arenaria]